MLPFLRTLDQAGCRRSCFGRVSFRIARTYIFWGSKLCPGDVVLLFLRLLDLAGPIVSIDFLITRFAGMPLSVDAAVGNNVGVPLPVGHG